MNLLLRTQRPVEIQGVLPPGARRTVKYASAPSGPRDPVFPLVSTPSLRTFMNNPGSIMSRAATMTRSYCHATMADPINVIRLGTGYRVSLGGDAEMRDKVMGPLSQELDEGAVAAELVRRIGDGDGSAESELVLRYEPRLRYVLQRQMPNSSDMEDVLQAALFATILKLRERSIAEPAKLGGYIFGVANNMKKATSRANLKLQLQTDPTLIDTATDERPGPSQQTAVDETTVIVREVLAELSEPRDREVLLRLYILQEERSLICEELGIEPEHLRKVIYRAKKRLKEKLVEADSKQALHLITD